MPEPFHLSRNDVGGAGHLDYGGVRFEGRSTASSSGAGPSGSALATSLMMSSRWSDCPVRKPSQRYWRPSTGVSARRRPRAGTIGDGRQLAVDGQARHEAGDDPGITREWFHWWPPRSSQGADRLHAKGASCQCAGRAWAGGRRCVAFQGSPTHPDGVTQPSSRRVRLHSGPLIGLTIESVADQQKDGGQLGQSLREGNHPLGQLTTVSIGRGRVNGADHDFTPFRPRSLGGNGTTK